MSGRVTTLHIGVYGHDCPSARPRHGCGLWPAGVPAALTYAEAEPVNLPDPKGRPWADLMDGLDGVVLIGHDRDGGRNAADAEELVAWCHDHKMPILAIDRGLHVLNTTHGGTLFFDLTREQPEALQHRCPPEPGLRHAINVIPDTQLAGLYGEGEVVVNSEHRRAVQRVARGFRASANALDGIVEAIEYDDAGDWFALGVQWQPASCTASGLDIQLFRGLINACRARVAETPRRALAAA
jgi:gamma-glutamyl-gamma-aminobutyrate hydrolase PuuD